MSSGFRSSSVISLVRASRHQKVVYQTSSQQSRGMKALSYARRTCVGKRIWERNGIISLRDEKRSFLLDFFEKQRRLAAQRPIYVFTVSNGIPFWGLLGLIHSLSVIMGLPIKFVYPAVTPCACYCTHLLVWFMDRL